MSYVPVHERVHPPRYPTYAESDMSDSEREREREREREPSKKRRREDAPSDADDEGADGRHAAPTPPATATAPATASSGSGSGISPSIFGIAPRNEVTRVVGDFIMRFGRGKANLEIELKLGTVVTQGPDKRRVRLPSLTETPLPGDYPSSFVSTMTKQQHASLNTLLNGAVQDGAGAVRFAREQHVDALYAPPPGLLESIGHAGGHGHNDKVRVSRDKRGAVVATIVKTRVADLNVHSPAEAFDWRISLSTETPVQFEPAPAQLPVNVREKDRAVYMADTCRVDLTVVTTKQGSRPPALSYELEIEVLDAPGLIAEGEKEERGEPNVFDDVLQSVLDTARLIIRNV